ncbi:MAG: sugar ABC transporter permease [Chloroflexi bacterium]|nr:sugar ABC transporter permease [Chloroflexota bacterium]
MTRRVRLAMWGYLFALPWILGLIIFWVGPTLASFYFGFTEYDIVSPAKFVGLANYIKAFTGDDLVWPSMQRTLYYTLIVVPLGVMGSFFLAVLLNQKLVGTNIFRTIFFMPHLVPIVASSLLWTWLLHPRVGPVNYVLDKLGLPTPGWFASPAWAIPACILVALWTGVGGNRMLIFLAGLQGVPEELYEAADIDGASRWAKLRHVTLPMISPTMFFNIVLGIIGALQVFSIAFVATAGGPSYATWFYALHIYNQAFRYFRMGYGSALAWIFAVVLVILTYIQMSLSERWVYYGGG